MLDDVKYEFLDYFEYRNRINRYMCDDELIKLGIDKQVIGKSEFGYDIDCITIGNGSKHLFVVGGTHGSEIISVDFVLQFISEIKKIDNFNPDEFKIFFIPMQNPEGFIVSTSFLNEIRDNFRNKSYEYYYNYKVDNIVSKVINEYNSFIVNIRNCNYYNDANKYLDSFKCFINTNVYWCYLRKLVNSIDSFVCEVNNISNVRDYIDLRYNLINICNNIINGCCIVRDINVLTIFRDYFINNDLWHCLYNNEIFKLHQDMFKGVSFNNISNKELRVQIEKMFLINEHPLGSQVTFDATGLGINLNANNKYNPGINAIKKGIDIYGIGARNNIRNYSAGPLGMPCINVDNFEYAVENKALYKILRSSYDSGNYVGCLLYHSTGGIIYYKPYEELMSNSKYKSYVSYNYDIASIYGESANYVLVDKGDTTGYGDLLRRTFPGVILIELSKMGGNPIAPYGDIDNIYNTFRCNYNGINNVLGYLKNNDVNEKKLSKKLR